MLGAAEQLEPFAGRLSEACKPRNPEAGEKMKFVFSDDPEIARLQVMLVLQSFRLRQFLNGLDPDVEEELSRIERRFNLELKAKNT